MSIAIKTNGWVKGNEATLEFEGRSYRASILKITRDLAGDWLQNHNHGNRNVNWGLVKRIAIDMDSGSFVFNGEPIIFASTGRLNDGQHRLLGLLESKSDSFVSLVFWGVPEDAFDSYDQGAKRTASNVLGLLGVQNSVAVSAAAHWIASEEANDPGGLNLGRHRLATNHTIIDVVERHPILAELSGVAQKTRTVLAPGITLYVATKIAEKHGVQLAVEFIDRLADGAGLGSDHPILVLRNHLLRDRNSSAKVSEVRRLAYAIKAVNAWVSGRPLKHLRWAKDEAFPKFS